MSNDSRILHKPRAPVLLLGLLLLIGGTDAADAQQRGERPTGFWMAVDSTEWPALLVASDQVIEMRPDNGLCALYAFDVTWSRGDGTRIATDSSGPTWRFEARPRTRAPNQRLGRQRMWVQFDRGGAMYERVDNPARQDTLQDCVLEEGEPIDLE